MLLPIMRLKRKSFWGKCGIVTCSVLFVLILLWKSDSSREWNQSYGRGHLRYVFREGFRDFAGQISDFKRFVEEMAQKCVSSARTVKLTANYTINSVLDSVKFEFGSQRSLAIKENKSAAHAQWSGPLVPEGEPLEIIVIPHSHNDPGWKKTYQQYFDDQTTHILTNMVEKLHQYPDMTFVWVESCFLDKWWTNQSQQMKDKFKSLIKSGRLEITSGMWVAPDEASPHYFALLDQMIEGHYWVHKNLGVVPESSLNFDQFGYSATMPYLAKKAGLKNVLIKRINRGLKELFGQQQKMNFHWRQFWDSTGKNDIFAHIDTYEWMSISDSCGPDRGICSMLDFQRQPDLPDSSGLASGSQLQYRVSKITPENFFGFAQKLVDQFRQKSANYRYRVMMLPHGGDFRYDTTTEWDRQYKNLKIFMNYVNDNKKTFNVHVRFGTLKDYFQEVDRQTAKYGLTFPTVSGDFYAYTEQTEYWVGYYTTRQFDKRLSREVLETLRAAELLTAIAFRNSNTKPVNESIKANLLKALESSRKSLGLFQHHDAITGTSRQHVVVDYEQLLTSAFVSLQNVLATVSEHVLVGQTGNSGQVLLPLLKRTSHNTLTERMTIPTLSFATKIVLVNTLTQFRTEIVSLNVQTRNIVLFDQNGQEVKFDIRPMSETSLEIQFEVRFPPLSLIVYTIKPSTEGSSRGQLVQETPKLEDSGLDFFCDNSLMNVTFVRETGSPSVVCYKTKNFCTKFKLDWRYYKGTGGAYTMISQGMDVSASQISPTVKFVKGNSFCGVEAAYDFFSFKITLPMINSITGRALHVEVFSDLSKIPGFVGDLALRVETSVNSGKIFYVDSNAFQLMGRKFRDSLPFDGNVYPMSAMSVLQDEELRLVVHSAQPHGVISRASGTIDFMLDRIATRSEMDLPEGVSDSKPTKTFFFIEFQSSGEFEQTGTTETAIPSINSIFLNDVLQHPIYQFYTRNDINIPKSALTFLKQPLSCDVILANVKNLLDVSSKFDGTSVTLFRRAVGCGTPSSDAFCPLFDSDRIYPGSLFEGTSQVTEMFLSHLMSKQDLGKYGSISLDPMDLKTFLLN